MNLAALYEIDLPTPLSLETELQCWKHKFQDYVEEELPCSPLQALNRCDGRIFPNICTLLRLICTIPVTSCEAERTFSALRRLKTFTQSTMKESRLNGLTLLHVHRSITVNLDDAVENFAKKSPRRVQFL